MKPAFPILLCATALVAACADSGANYTPILDGPDTPAFQADLAACQELARSQKQFDQETMGAAALGGIAGAALGAADDSMSDAEGIFGGLIVGTLAGGAAGAVSASDRRESIVLECLRGRGYRVVG